MATLNNVVASLQKEYARLEAELGQVRKALNALGQVSGRKQHATRVRRPLSPEARRRIAEAQRQRWAKVRKQAGKQAKS